MSDRNLLLREEDILRRTENLREILGYFGISASKFCDFFTIQPYMFYDCAAGVSVDPRINNIFDKFQNIYSEFKNAGIENGRHALTMLIDGATALVLIKHGNDYKEHLQKLINEVLIHYNQRKNIDAMLYSKNGNSFNHSDDYMLLTLPAGREEE